MFGVETEAAVVGVFRSRNNAREELFGLEGCSKALRHRPARSCREYDRRTAVRRLECYCIGPVMACFLDQAWPTAMARANMFYGSRFVEIGAWKCKSGDNNENV